MSVIHDFLHILTGIGISFTLVYWVSGTRLLTTVIFVTVIGSSINIYLVYRWFLAHHGWQRGFLHIMAGLGVSFSKVYLGLKNKITETSEVFRYDCYRFLL